MFLDKYQSNKQGQCVRRRMLRTFPSGARRPTSHSLRSSSSCRRHRAAGGLRTPGVRPDSARRRRLGEPAAKGGVS